VSRERAAGRGHLCVKRFDLFLSHSSSDKAWVLRLKAALEQRGLKVWVDADEIRPGDLFVHALERGLEASSTVGLVVSPESLESGWVQEEYARALALSREVEAPHRLIPIVLRDAHVPGFLASRNRVDFRDDFAFEQNVERLVWGITGQKPIESAWKVARKRAILDRRLIAELIVALSRPCDARRVDLRAFHTVLYAFSFFEAVFVENHFGSLLHSTMRADQSGLLGEALLVLPLDPPLNEPAVSEAAGAATSLWLKDPGLYAAAAAYGRSKDSLNEDIASVMAYIQQALLLARSFDAAVVPHPRRWPVYQYLFDNCQSDTGRTGAARTALSTVHATPSTVARALFPDRADRIQDLAAATGSAPTATLVRVGPLVYPFPPRYTEHSAIGSTFEYEFCVANPLDGDARAG
jgi:hypothetical protein